MKNKCEKNQRILAIAIASLLLYAGIVKQLRLLEIPLHSQSGHFSQTALVVGEFFLASLLISGMQPFFTFFTAAVVFFCFSLYQLASLLGVTGTCDCLGRFSPSPGVMLCIDIVSFAGLAIAARSSFRSSACLSQKLERFRPVTFFLILLSCLFFVARNTQQWKYLSDVYSAETFASADNRNLFVVSGEDWVGKSFPVLPFVTRSAISTLPNS